MILCNYMSKRKDYTLKKYAKNMIHQGLHKKMKFSIEDFFSKCDQISRKQLIWSHLLKKSLNMISNTIHTD